MIDHMIDQTNAWQNTDVFLNALPSDLPRPSRVAEDSRGGFSVEWSRGPRRVLSVSFDAGGRACYERRLDFEYVCGEVVLDDWGLLVISGLARRVLS